MSYLVLARKWRPRNFSEMVGQQHVLKTLINALEQKRLHHAYLFTGTRGVGKTTIARILAKCLSCEDGVTATPCGICKHCKAISAGAFVDLIEVDAASRTKVEDTREILENVQYAPTQGRYKVYLIDEVHMLSNHSFNALLKTLEEPPEHVIFLLATTDPQKLPATVLSRCLQFDLKNMPKDAIVQHLEHILETEAIPFETDALWQLAHAAKGSMRDALSLLDQAIAFSQGHLKEADIRQMLGTMSRDQSFAILKALADGDGQALVAHSQQLQSSGTDFNHALAMLIENLHHISLAQVVPDALGNPHQEQEAILQLANALSREEVQLYYQIALHGRRDLALAPSPSIGFEMTLLRLLAFKPAEGGSLPVKKPQSATHKAPKSHSTTVVRTPLDSPSIQEPVQHADASPKESPKTSTTPTAITDNWPTILEHLSLRGMSQVLANHCVLEHIDEQKIALNLGQEHSALLNDNTKARLQEAVEKHLQRPIKLVINTTHTPLETPAKANAKAKEKAFDKAQEMLEKDPHFNTLLVQFDATIAPGSITALAEES